MVLGLGYVHCPKHQLLCSRNNDLMSQVLKQVTCLCAMLRQSFAFFPVHPPLYWAIKAYENETEVNSELRIQHTVCIQLPSCYYSFLSLFLLSNISNLHVPTLEHMNLPWLGPQQKYPKKVGTSTNYRIGLVLMSSWPIQIGLQVCVCVCGGGVGHTRFV